MHVHPAQPINSSTGIATAPLPVTAEDQARADLYALLARLLLAPPDAALLAGLAAADPICAEQDDRKLEEAWHKLAAAASVTDADAVAEEFNALFISVGTPALNPYGSLYIAGFMNNTPLAGLRADLARLRIGRASGAYEFEDHLGALCETMRVLVAGGPGIPRQSVGEQKGFFDRHVAPWYARCLADMANAEEANFYRCVAGFALAFLSIEAEAFALEEAIDD